MRLSLAPLGAEADPATLAAQLAPAFGGDPEPALALLNQTFDLLTRDPRPAPWGAYLASADDVVVGTCAFKAAPDESATVEIAYMTFPAFEARGHASAMAGALVEIARNAGAVTVIAHTLPEENASTRALSRNNFVFVGETIDPEDGLVWRWQLPVG